MLRDLQLPAQMSKGPDDIAAGFYLPSMRAATRYDRASGYFSSAIYLIAWPAMRGFVEREGRVRVICSPALPPSDLDSLVLGYRARTDQQLADVLGQELRGLLGDERLARPTRALAALVAEGYVELRIALVDRRASPDAKRMFHDKVGVFTDERGDRVGFRGTMNETYLGLSSAGNLESIDIFPSWMGGRDAERVLEASARFEQLWESRIPGAATRPFPALAISELKEAADRRPLEVQLEDLITEEVAEEEPTPTVGGDVYVLRAHQTEAIAAWEANSNRGLLEHATGSGKTLTAIEAIRRRLAARDAPIVVVPSEALLEQWAREVRTHLSDMSPGLLLCGAGHDSWAKEGLLKAWIRSAAAEPRLVLAVVNTAAQERFTESLAGRTNLMLVADEAHRLGSPTFRRVFQIDARARLGLSATPNRYGDAVGTAVLYDYFGGIVHRYGLADALRDGYLTRYTYHPHAVELTSEEMVAWSEASAQIRRRYGRLASSVGSEGAQADVGLKMLLVRRARIAKSAERKVALAERVISESFSPGHRWLVYCDSKEQVHLVREGLRSRGLQSAAYYSGMSADEQRTLREFEVNGGILVAIRCLDEGVDIPTASHALILASSRNPREFIQRRGRVLRRHPSKKVSHIHDAIVVPAADGELAGPARADSLAWAEMARALEFAASASNIEARTRLERICVDLGLDVARLSADGFEYDDEVGGNGEE